MHNIVYMAPVEAMRGKFAKNSTVITKRIDSAITPTRLNRQGNIYGVQYFVSNWRPGVNMSKYFNFKNQAGTLTATQEANINKFVTTADDVAAARADAQKWQTIRTAFANQTTYRTLNGYAFYLAFNNLPPFND